MFIQNRGTFWHRDAVEWNPGRGRPFRLLGRQGVNYGTLRICDFTEQTGFYVLYGDHGVYYAGIALERGLGIRLREHTTNQHAPHWDKFSWYGLQKVLERSDRGIRDLAGLASTKQADPKRVAEDIEALLVEVFQPRGNQNNPWFQIEDHWLQVPTANAEDWLSRAAG